MLETKGRTFVAWHAEQCTEWTLHVNLRISRHCRTVQIRTSSLSASAVPALGLYTVASCAFISPVAAQDQADDNLKSVKSFAECSSRSGELKNSLPSCGLFRANKMCKTCVSFTVTLGSPSSEKGLP